MRYAVCLAAFLASLLAAGSTIDLQIGPWPIERVVRQLSAQTGRDYVVSQEMRGHFVAIYVTDRREEEILAKIADVTFGVWRRDGNTFVLRRDSRALSEYRDSLNEVALFDNNLVRYSPQTKWEKAVHDMLKQWPSRLKEEVMRGPVSLSSHPSEEQRQLPGNYQPVIDALLGPSSDGEDTDILSDRELRIADSMAEHFALERSIGLRALGLDESSITRPLPDGTDPELVVLSTKSWLGIDIAFYLANRDGSVVASRKYGFLLFSDDAKADTFEWVPAVALARTEREKQFDQILTSRYMFPRTWDDAQRQILFHPEKHEPLELFLGGTLSALSQHTDRDLVASIPDGNYSDSLGVHLRETIESLSSRVHIQHDEEWVLIRDREGVEPAAAASRDDLANCLAAVGSHGVSLQTFSEYIKLGGKFPKDRNFLHSVCELYTYLVSGYFPRRLIDPYAIEVWAHLGESQRSALLSGESVTILGRNGKLFEAINEWLTWDIPLPFSKIAPSFEYDAIEQSSLFLGTADSRIIHLEQLSSELPNNSIRLEATVYEEPFALPVNERDEAHDIVAWQRPSDFAWRVLAQRRLPDRMIIASGRTVILKVIVNDRFIARGILTDIPWPDSPQIIGRGVLPTSFTERMARQIEFLKSIGLEEWLAS
jgi:hypothetical protein